MCHICVLSNEVSAVCDVGNAKELATVHRMEWIKIESKSTPALQKKMLKTNYAYLGYQEEKDADYSPRDNFNHNKQHKKVLLYAADFLKIG